MAKLLEGVQSKIKQGNETLMRMAHMAQLSKALAMIKGLGREPQHAAIHQNIFPIGRPVVIPIQKPQMLIEPKSGDSVVMNGKKVLSIWLEVVEELTDRLLPSVLAESGVTSPTTAVTMEAKTVAKAVAESAVKMMADVGEFMWQGLDSLGEDTMIGRIRLGDISQIDLTEAGLGVVLWRQIPNQPEIVEGNRVGIKAVDETRQVALRVLNQDAKELKMGAIFNNLMEGTVAGPLFEL